MCSTASFGGNSCGTTESVMKSKTNKRTDLCFKCKTAKPFVVIRHGDPFCGNCFDTHVIHKFRQGLGKTKILYPGETVILNVPGNISSLAMLHLMASGYDKTSHKKITADPKIVLIDDSSLFDMAESPVPAVLSVVEKVPDMPRQTIVIPFELIFLENYREMCREFYLANKTLQIIDLKEMEVDFENLAEKARQMFRKIKTPSAREDLHRSLHIQLLTSAADILNSTKIMLSDTATDLAARLLSSVAVGRGSYLPNETQYLDTRLPGITFINCMREFTPKECLFYLRRLNISPITVVTHSTLSDPIVGSINRLTDTFISGLQANFPSTVNTVMKTSAKLQALSNTNSNCNVCYLPLVKSDDIESEFSVLDIQGKSRGVTSCHEVCSGCEIVFSESDESVKMMLSSNTKQVLDEFLLD